MPKYNALISLIIYSLLLIIVIISLFSGAVSIGLWEIISPNKENFYFDIFYNIRLPRVLLGAIVGAALGVSGAVMQSLFRNPLADPSLIGVSSGAALFVATFIVFFQDDNFLIANYYLLSIVAFFGSIFTCTLILSLSKISGEISVAKMLLVGIAINAFAGACMGIVIFVSSDTQLKSITLWSMGSLSGAPWSSVIISYIIIIPLIIAMIKNSKQYDVILLGYDEAKYLGVDIKKLQLKTVTFVALIIGISVAFSGIIAFVGLAVPHIIRAGISSHNRFLIPTSALLGASLLVASDTIARTILSPVELSVGIITSLIGAPIFLYLLFRQFSYKEVK